MRAYGFYLAIIIGLMSLTVHADAGTIHDTVAAHHHHHAPSTPDVFGLMHKSF